MARTIEEIKKSMTDRFLSDETLRQAYSIEGDATWDSSFSKVSVENMLMYVVAFVAHTLEVMMDAFRKDVDTQIAQNIVPTVRWYHTQAMAFQYGDQLVYNEEYEHFEYPESDDSKKLIKYCAVKDRGGSIQVLVSGETNGAPSVLSNNVLSAFKSYMNQVKVAGVILDVKSLAADGIRISATVHIDPQIITVDGTRISDGTYAVEDAVNAYLAGIVYGGTFNKTKLVDAIQNVEGVVDVILQDVQVKSSGSTTYNQMASNNYTALSGCFKVDKLNETLEYVV